MRAAGRRLVQASIVEHAMLTVNAPQKKGQDAPGKEPFAAVGPRGALKEQREPQKRGVINWSSQVACACSSSLIVMTDTWQPSRPSRPATSRVRRCSRGCSSRPPPSVKVTPLPTTNGYPRTSTRRVKVSLGQELLSQIPQGLYGKQQPSAQHELHCNRPPHCPSC